MVTLVDTGRFRFRVSLLLPLVWMGAILSGRDLSFAAAYLCVTLHEFAHAAALWALRLPVHRIDLTPVGAVLASDAELALHPGAEAAMAFAGPAMNLILALVTHVLLLRGIAVPHAELFIRIHLALALGNLIPALPMDGGHILRAALTRQIGIERACRMTAWIGVAISLLLLALGAYLWITQALLRAELFFLPVLIAIHARESLWSGTWMAMSSAGAKRRQLLASGILPIRHAAIDTSTRLHRLTRRLTPRYYYIFTVIDETGSPQGSFTEEHLLTALRTQNPLTAGEMVRNACGNDRVVIE